VLMPVLVTPSHGSVSFACVRSLFGFAPQPFPYSPFH
jgi:hypothetical protein